VRRRFGPVHLVLDRPDPVQLPGEQERRAGHQCRRPVSPPKGAGRPAGRRSRFPQRGGICAPCPCGALQAAEGSDSMAVGDLEARRTHPGITRAGPAVAGDGRPPGVQQRVRVDGKFFARGGQRLRVHGVTYGPFAPDAEGQPFPTWQRVGEDFARMRAAGINAVRTYHVPPEWLLRLADAEGTAAFVGLTWVDVPWRTHLHFLESRQTQSEARQFVRRAALLGQGHPCLLAYCIGNEFPPDALRWHGARRVERFLAELADVARQADPDGLVTYASYPPTEYLDLSFLDFVTFNVYLHDREAFRRYLFRLLNLVGDRPLLLGELGMDTFRHGELGQAAFLAGHLREARLMGLAGAFVFSWTDDWHTGGHAVGDWAFGITHADRSPKAACHAVREAFGG